MIAPPRVDAVRRDRRYGSLSVRPTAGGRKPEKRAPSWARAGSAPDVRRPSDRPEECDEVGLFLRGQGEGGFCSRTSTTLQAIVTVDDIRERGRAAVVEVGRGLDDAGKVES